MSVIQKEPSPAAAAEGTCIHLDDDEGVIAVGTRNSVLLVSRQDGKLNEVRVFFAVFFF